MTDFASKWFFVQSFVKLISNFAFFGIREFSNFDFVPSFANWQAICGTSLKHEFWKKKYEIYVKLNFFSWNRKTYLCDKVHIEIAKESLQDDDDRCGYGVYCCRRNSVHSIHKRHVSLACVFDEYVSEAYAVKTKIVLELLDSPKLISRKIWVTKTQCGKFRIFLSLRFYVKSIFENLEVLKLTFLPFLGALNFVNLVHFSLQKVQKSMKIKIYGI